MEPWSREWREQQLYLIYEQWKDCTHCHLSETRKNVVFGAGNPEAKILLVGEGPGEEEDKHGMPFVGPSGSLLQALCRNAGLPWEELYVTNIAGCRPIDEHGKNRDPNPIERDACISRVHQIIYLVDPLVVVPVGKAALKALGKGRDWAITEERGKVFSSPHVSVKLTGDPNCAEIIGHVFPKKDAEKREVWLEYDMIPILHPSYLLREDPIDEKSGRFSHDGLTNKTFEDLKTIKRYVALLEKEYASVPKFERR